MCWEGKEHVRHLKHAHRGHVSGVLHKGEGERQGKEEGTCQTPKTHHMGCVFSVQPMEEMREVLNTKNLPMWTHFGYLAGWRGYGSGEEGRGGVSQFGRSVDGVFLMRSAAVCCWGSVKYKTKQKIVGVPCMPTVCFLLCPLAFPAVSRWRCHLRGCGCDSGW